jgi:hypothetical protein
MEVFLFPLKMGIWHGFSSARSAYQLFNIEDAIDSAKFDCFNHVKKVDRLAKVVLSPQPFPTKDLTG